MSVAVAKQHHKKGNLLLVMDGRVLEEAAAVSVAETCTDDQAMLCERKLAQLISKVASADYLLSELITGVIGSYHCFS